MRRRVLLLGALLVALPGAEITWSQSATLKAVRLTTEFRSNPVGVGAAAPMFAWNLESTVTGMRGLVQSGYRIRLAESPGMLQRRPLWDSGRVVASTYWQRAYGGPALRSHTSYFWQVQAFREDNAGPWSEVARFTTTLLADEEWSAKWIAVEPDRAAAPAVAMGSEPPPLPVFRHNFVVVKPVAQALLFVAGLGQYEVHLNGNDVTNTALNESWSDYRKTVPYDTYDVTRMLHTGKNAFGVLLGNGMYNVEEVKGHYTKFAGSYGQPKLTLQMEVRYADGTSARFVSDGSWQTHPGPVVYSSTYGGEAFDAGALPEQWDRAGFGAPGWSPATVVAGPGGRLKPSLSPPMAVAQSIDAVRVTKPKPGVTVYDLGQNMSGWPRITVSGAAAAKVTLLAGELLNADGTVTQRSANAFPAAPVLFTYTLRGGGVEAWHPRFAYYSFRYVQVAVEAAVGGGEPPRVLTLAGDFVHARVETVGTFDSSDEMLVRIHKLIDRAVLSNLASVITDCPSREKLGWLEQTYLNAGTLMLNYGVMGVYEKLADDMRDAQLGNGLVPSIAPEYVAFVDKAGASTAFRDSPEWGSAIILSPWALYQYTGDRRPLERDYSSMQKYAAYLGTRAEGKLLNYGLGDWYDIGPRPPGPSQLTSRMVTATGVYYEDLKTLAQIAALLDKAGDAASYAREAEDVRAAFNARLFHVDEGEYDHGSQTANALPLALGLAPDGRATEVLEHLVADIHMHGNHVTAGDVGFHYVVRALTEYGRSDVLAAMFSRTDAPSYGYQLAQGATTLTEAWDANRASSQNHFMLGHGEEWFYRGLAGLSVDMARGPAEAIELRPSLFAGVERAAATFRSAMGPVRLAWAHEGMAATVDVSVPAGAVANLSLPGTGVWKESGKSAARARGVRQALKVDRGLQLRLGSGDYHFSALSAAAPGAATSR